MVPPHPSLFAPQVYPSDWHPRGTQPLPELVPGPDALPPPPEPVPELPPLPLLAPEPPEAPEPLPNPPAPPSPLPSDEDDMLPPHPPHAASSTPIPRTATRCWSAPTFRSCHARSVRSRGRHGTKREGKVDSTDRTVVVPQNSQGPPKVAPEAPRRHPAREGRRCSAWCLARRSSAASSFLRLVATAMDGELPSRRERG